MGPGGWRRARDYEIGNRLNSASALGMHRRRALGSEQNENGCASYLDELRRGIEISLARSSLPPAQPPLACS